MKKKDLILDLFLRYIVLIITMLIGLKLFYFIFSVVTIYPVYFLLGLFYEAILIDGFIIFMSGIKIELIGPCIAGSAYSLLLILNLATPNIKIRKRLKVLFLSFLALLILNIIRIFILSILVVKSMFYFNLVHMLFWYILSVVFVITIWFYLVKRFKIKKIPFYSDLKFLYNLMKKSK